MLKIVMVVDGNDDAQGTKEQLAMLVERFGNVRVVEVVNMEAKQLRMEEFSSQ